MLADAIRAAMNFDNVEAEDEISEQDLQFFWSNSTA